MTLCRITIVMYSRGLETDRKEKQSVKIDSETSTICSANNPYKLIAFITEDFHWLMLMQYHSIAASTVHLYHTTAVSCCVYTSAEYLNLTVDWSIAAYAFKGRIWVISTHFKMKEWTVSHAGALGLATLLCYKITRSQTWPKWGGASHGGTPFLCHCMSLVCSIGVRQHPAHLWFLRHCTRRTAQNHFSHVSQLYALIIHTIHVCTMKMQGKCFLAIP